MSKLLSPAQVAAYERDGFVCPVPVLSAAEAQSARAVRWAPTVVSAHPGDGKCRQECESYQLHSIERSYQPQAFDRTHNLLAQNHRSTL
jgi:hypothetical protein